MHLPPVHRDSKVTSSFSVEGNLYGRPGSLQLTPAREFGVAKAVLTYYVHVGAVTSVRTAGDWMARQYLQYPFRGDPNGLAEVQQVAQLDGELNGVPIVGRANGGGNPRVNGASEDREPEECIMEPAQLTARAASAATNGKLELKADPRQASQENLDEEGALEHPPNGQEDSKDQPVASHASTQETEADNPGAQKVGMQQPPQQDQSQAFGGARPRTTGKEVTSATTNGRAIISSAHTNGQLSHHNGSTVASAVRGQGDQPTSGKPTAAVSGAATEPQPGSTQSIHLADLRFKIREKRMRERHQRTSGMAAP